jgi:hypothetical protein
VDDTIAVLKATVDESLRIAGAAWGLVRGELSRPRSRAVVLIWLGFGQVIHGVGSIALANILGALVVVHQMRGCWRDLALPRTRRAIAEFREPAP